MSIELNDTSALLGARVLADMIDALDPEAQLAITGEDVEELAHLHVSLTRSAQRLSTIKAAVEAALVEVMPDKTVELPGLPVLERRQGSVRKAWQYEDVISALARQAEGDLSALLDSLLACAPITPSMQWRVGELRARGLDPDEFCSSTPGRVSIQIHDEAAK